MIHRRSLCWWIAAAAALVAACGDGDTFGDGGLQMQGSTSMTDRCGDGVTSGSEQCDDGNSASGDGCSNLCKSESPSDGTPGPSPNTGVGDAGTSASGAQDAAVSGMDAASGATAGDASSAADSALVDDAGATGDAAGPAAPEPLCPAEPANECEACNCTMCKPQLDACSTMTGEASEGPGMGKTKASLCEALVRCGRMTGCRSIGCLCTDTSCLADAGPPPDGPCKDDVLAAAETTDVMTFLTRATMPDMGYAVAVASAVSNCAASSCSNACMQ